MTAQTKFKTIAITLAAMGTAIAPAAFATSTDEVRVEIDTRYLETDWGVEKVYTALTNRAESACTTGASRDLSERKFARDCMSDLLDDFIESADHEKLTAFHASIVS